EQHVPLNVFVRGCSGCLDTTFGKKGLAAISANPYLIALDASDRIVLVEYDNQGQYSLARFSADGAIDNSFGTRGTTSLTMRALGLAVAASGAPLVTGFHSSGGPTDPVYGAASRFDPNGSPDSTFGQGGITELTTSWTLLGSVALLPDGSFVSAG